MQVIIKIYIIITRYCLVSATTMLPTSHVSTRLADHG
jgi:hypothetical protein